MLGFGSLLGTERGGLCLLWLPGKRRLFIALQKSVTDLTSTDQTSLMACCFFVDQPVCPRCTQGSGEPSWLAPLALHPKNPPIHWLWMCCLFCVSHSCVAFWWWYFISWTFCEYTASSKKKKKVCKLNLICFKMIFVIEVPAVVRIEHLGVTVV